MQPTTQVQITHKLDYLREFGDLFVDIQMSGIFSDSITFNDCVPKFPAQEIIKKYEIEKELPAFDLAHFLLDNFDLPDFIPQHYETNLESSIEEHIESLWDILTREHQFESGSSLIPVPHPYVVPGGRFRGLYYWDSYFTALGLEENGKIDLIESILENFAFLIEQFGFIPNANRTYYLGRSQPPVFALMIGILANHKGPAVWDRYIPFLEKEYKFWMKGHELVTEDNPSESRVVRLPDGTLLNRYWDDYAMPRPESYREDVEVGRQSGRNTKEVFRHIRAGAESGWDFSSRWFKNGLEMVNIHTTDILPVDLNCLILNIENTLLNYYSSRQRADDFTEFVAQSATSRFNALHRYFWCENDQFFKDFDWVENQTSQAISLAGVYPLFFQVASAEQAAGVAKALQEQFLCLGGFVTTLCESGQQWDLPNGWAPLHWMVFKGLENYGYTELAREGIGRWLKVNRMVYNKTGKMTEKYNMLHRLEDAQGGEYPNQDGFGWTNGVFLKLSRILMES
ncbi:MAG: alpha,alpha-trehalase TreF [Spirosomataceae bacterium]